MKRFPHLWKSFARVLNNEVAIGGSVTEEEFLSPLDKIIPPLFAANKEVHRLQGELSAGRDHSAEEIRQANDIIFPAEQGVKAMIRHDVNVMPYGKVAAKVTDAGDKLDKVVLNEINKLEKRFRERYKRVKKWRRSYGFENINPVRKELEEITNGFFELAEVYVQRELPEKKIRSARRIFDDYRKKIEVMGEVDEEVKNLREAYQRISSLEHLKEFLGEMRKSGLRKKSSRAEYKEGAAYIDDLEKEVKSVIKDFARINRRKRSIRSNIERLEADYRELEDMAKGKRTLKRLREIEDSVNPDKYQSKQRIIYLKGDCAEYRETAEKVLEKVSWIKKNKEKIYRENLTRSAPKSKVPGKGSNEKAKTRQYFEGLLRTCRDKDERYRLYVQAADQETIDKGSVDGSSYFGISYNLKKLGENEKYIELKDILNADRKASVDDLVQLSIKIREMTAAKDFAEDKQNLEFIEGFYCCVREPLRRGAFLRLRTPENEKVITGLLDNFERYIARSKKHLITQGSPQYSKVG
jgi:hypothetical protein